MSKHRQIAAFGAAGLVAALLIGGCSYDYVQNTDRVTYGAGDAVQANLQAQTTNPANPNSNNTSDLGENGVVDPAVGSLDPVGTTP